MNSNTKKNINTVGKIGRIIAGITAVCMIIAGCFTAIAAVYFATLPKENIAVELNGTAEVTSRFEGSDPHISFLRIDHGHIVTRLSAAISHIVLFLTVP